MSKTIKTEQDVIQAIRDGWEADTIVKCAVTPSGRSVKELLRLHASVSKELSNIKAEVSVFADIIRGAASVLDESDDKLDWAFAGYLYDMIGDLANEIGCTSYEDGEWINSEY